MCFCYLIIDTIDWCGVAEAVVGGWTGRQVVGGDGGGRGVVGRARGQGRPVRPGHLPRVALHGHDPVRVRVLRLLAPGLSA